MKLFFLPLLFAGVSGSSFAALVTFETPTYSYSTPPGPVNSGNPNGINGQDGWTQSEPTFVETTMGPEFGNQYPIFYTENGGGTTYGTIGGVYATPSSLTSFSASRNFASAGTVGNTAFSFQASIQEFVQSPTDFDTARNTFGFSLSDGATTLLTVTLEPDSQTGPTQWEVFYQIGGAGSPSATGLAFVPGGPSGSGGLYNLKVDFSNTGLNFFFQATSGGPSFGVFGTPTGYAPLSTNAIKAEFNWDKGLGANFGDNRMLIDNIQTVAVPEPGSLLLLSLAGLGFLRRRR